MRLITLGRRGKNENQERELGRGEICENVCLAGYSETEPGSGDVSGGLSPPLWLIFQSPSEARTQMTDNHVTTG